jgi:hypothetical protein
MAGVGVKTQMYNVLNALTSKVATYNGPDDYGNWCQGVCFTMPRPSWYVQTGSNPDMPNLWFELLSTKMKIPALLVAQSVATTAASAAIQRVKLLLLVRQRARALHKVAVNNSRHCDIGDMPVDVCVEIHGFVNAMTTTL